MKIQQLLNYLFIIINIIIIGIPTATSVASTTITKMAKKDQKGKINLRKSSRSWKTNSSRNAGICFQLTCMLA